MAMKKNTIKKIENVPVKVLNVVTPSEIVTNKAHVFCSRCNNEMNFNGVSNWNCPNCNKNILDMR